MTRTRLFAAAASAAALLLPAAFAAAAHADEAPCRARAAKMSGGGFMTARTFEVSMDYPDVPYQKLYDQVYMGLIQNHWTKLNDDPQRGVIQVEQPITNTRRMQPLNAIIKPRGSGSTATITYVVGPLTFPDYKEDLCKPLDGIGS